MNLGWLIQSLVAGLVFLRIPEAHGQDLSDPIFLGSGAKSGEMTDHSAILLVRLTSLAGQNAEGLIPGRKGQLRVWYETNETLQNPQMTEWQTVRPEEDFAVKIRLTELTPARRYYYRVEMRASEKAATTFSEVHSFVTAPAADQRAPVMFHLTTCQDTRGESTYAAMAAQHPDFCISAGDTVYYDGEHLARDVPQAWQSYQKMFGLPLMKAYYRNVGGYFMKDDHDYRFNDADPFMKGKWVGLKAADPGARFTETRGNQKLDEAWLTHDEGIRVFKQVFPLGEKTFRTVRWGRGLQIWMLENRDFRSPNEMPDGPEKSIWGKEQKTWLMETLAESNADYRVIISPNPLIGPDRLMKGDNHANLNGFWNEGQEFLNWLRDQQLKNVVLMCGDRHWQYHSIDRRAGRYTHEFSCGPTSDDHVQNVPPLYEGVERPYAASRGGFLSVRYQPEDRSLVCNFHSMSGESVYRKVVLPE